VSEAQSVFIIASQVLNRLSSIDRSDKKLESQFLSMQLHVGVPSGPLEESERVRAACLSYLQRWLKYFVRQRPDIVNKLEHLADDLGGQLTKPATTLENTPGSSGSSAMASPCAPRSFLPGGQMAIYPILGQSVVPPGRSKRRD